jgi:mRNA interferase MazF
VRRGEVWWAEFDEQHPVVLLSEGSSGCGRHHESGVRAVQIVAASGLDISGLGLKVTVGTRDNLPFEGVVRVAFPRPGFVPCTWATTVGADQHCGTGELVAHSRSGLFAHGDLVSTKGKSFVAKDPKDE